MTSKNRESNSQDNFGLDSVMKPLDPNEARQPVSDDVLNEMQSTHESDRSGDETAASTIENPDAIAQGNSDSGDPDVSDHQIIAANRSAS